MLTQLSILIVSYESADDLAACLASIEAHPPVVTHEVIVVDNASSDFDLQRFEAAHPTVKFLRSDRNLTFTGGSNLAFHESTGELVLLLNPDTRVEPGALDAAVRAIDDSARRPSIVSAYLYDLDGSFQRYYRRFPTRADLISLVLQGPLQRLPGFRRYLMEDVDFAGVVPVPQPPGAFMLVRRPPTRNLLDPGYMNFFSDVDLAWRLGRGSASFVYPDVRVAHRMGGAGLQPSRVVDQIRLRHDFHHGMLRFARRRWGPIGSGPVFVAIIAAWIGLIARSLARKRLEELRLRAAALLSLLLNRPPSYCCEGSASTEQV